MKKTIKNNKSSDLTKISADDIRKEIAARVGTTDVPENKKSNEPVLMSLAEALDAYDPLTEVVSSNELLDLQMCLSVGQEATWDIEPLTTGHTKTDKSVPMALYLYAFNKKGKIKSIKLNKDDIALLNKLKYRPIKLGIPGTTNPEIPLFIKQIMGDIQNGPTKTNDEDIRKMLTAAKNRKARFIKDPTEYSAIYNHDQDAARKAMGIKKPSWIKKLWYKITGKSEEKELIAQLSKVCKNDRKLFPESLTSIVAADEVFGRINVEALQTKYNKEALSKTEGLREELNIK